jgi:hypothetical protein
MSQSTNDGLDGLRRQLARRHYLLGWCGLLVFLTLGFVLEGLHGFKLDFYLGADHKVRREMWTLAHAHGTLLSLVSVAFATGLPQFGTWTEGRLKIVSFFLLDATILLPGGFFLGGLEHTEADPSAGILLVPLGALLLLLAVALTAWSAWKPWEGK